MSVQVENLTKIYNTQRAINRISFTVNKGEIAGFIGPNGSGKTTTMKIICGILSPTSGNAFINNINVRENHIECKKKIGYLPEHNPLYDEMYVIEYLKYIAGIYKIKNAKKRIKNIIEKTGIIKEADKKIGFLSKGYRQRVGIAQALIHEPEILILDEPTTGLDPNQIMEIRNLIKEFSKEKTVLLSTHILQEVEAICDKVIIINNGEIVADGKSKDIANKSRKSPVTVFVEFDKAVDDQSLLKIEQADKIKKINDRNFIIESKDSSVDIRPLIFQYAVENGLKVLSLQQKDQNLEEVFRNIVKNE